MTIPEAVMLVLQAGVLGSGGEIFILDMGEPVRIEELACQLIRGMGYEPNREIKIAYTGIRPGEKLYEELSFNAETMAKTTHPQVWSLINGRPGDLEEFEADFEKMIRFAIKQGSRDVVRDKLIELVELVDNKCFSGSGDDIAREQVAATK
jgi:FlaA1/EpsC-like NDP-sugar epimerase